MEKKNVRYVDRKVTISGVIFILISLFVILKARSFPAGSDGLPGSGLFPNILGGLLLVLSGMMLYHNLRNKEVIQEKLIEKKALVAIFISFIYVSLLNLLGFLIMTIPFLVVLMALFDKKDIKKSLPISVITVVVIYYIFGNLLNVPLPEQTLFM